MTHTPVLSRLLLCLALCGGPTGCHSRPLPVHPFVLQKDSLGTGYRELKLHFAPTSEYDLEPGTRPLIGVGDSLWLRIDSYQCSRDICGLDLPTTRRTVFDWSSSAPCLASVDSLGVLVGRHVGTTRITAVRGITRLSQDVRVIPPVARLAWHPYPSHARVGDTLRLVAIAHDSGGAPLLSVPLAFLQGAVTYPAPAAAGDTLVVVLSGAGTFRAVALLGRRRAEAVVVVDSLASP